MYYHVHGHWIIVVVFVWIFTNHKCLTNAAKAKGKEAKESRDVSSDDNGSVKELKQLNSDYGQEKFEVSELKLKKNYHPNIFNEFVSTKYLQSVIF
jgi:Sec-independent protein translocase protein TatA